MKNRLSLLLIVACFVHAKTFSQNVIFSKYKKGTITTTDGQTIEGYIFFDMAHTDNFQSSVSYLTPTEYEIAKAADKVKLKQIERLKPSEARSYTLDDGRKFSSVTYADLTSVTLPKKYFLEELAAGTITLYRKYPSNNGMIAGEQASAVMQGGAALEDYNRRNAELVLYKQGDKNAKNISTIKLQDYISDKPEILEKYNNDGYGQLKANFSTKLKLGEVSHYQHEEALIQLVNEYNNAKQ